MNIEIKSVDIVKLRQGSGKERQGKARKGKERQVRKGKERQVRKGKIRKGKVTEGKQISQPKAFQAGFTYYTPL